MPTVDLPGVRLSYRQTGAGPDVLLIHGLAANQAFWSPALVAHLARRWRVTAFDLRGHGYSSMPACGYRASDLAADALGLCDALGVSQAHLVGHSYGGVAALELALRWPGRVGDLVVADTRLRSVQPRQPLRDDEFWPQIQRYLAQRGMAIADDEPELGLRLLEALAAPELAGLRRKLQTQSAFVPFGGGGRMAKRWLRLVRETTLTADVQAGDGLTESDLAALKGRLLLSYGSRSPCLATGRRLCELHPRAMWRESPGTGHFHPVVESEAFAIAVDEFLRGGDNTPTP